MAATYEELPFLSDEAAQKHHHEKLGYYQRDQERNTSWINKLGAQLSPYKVILLVMSNLVLLGYLIFQHLYPYDPTLALYSPANHVVSYKSVVFTGSDDPQTKYMPPVRGGLPDDDVDKAWEQLYTATIIKVPEDSARQLVNWTSPIPGDEGNYITILDVFHQLHCLNLIRRSVYPERYHGQLLAGNVYHNITNEHVEHCIDSLRQLITCQSDLSTHYWRWDAEYKHTRTYNQVTHTCRDFEAIQSWASERILRNFDGTVHLHDSLRTGEDDWHE